MPGATPTYGFPYQQLGDPPHGPNLGEQLALAVEAALADAVATAAADLATAVADAAANLAAAEAALTADIADIGSTWTPYTPTWTTSGTQPVIGNGALKGIWSRIGDLVRVRITLILGSTSTVGTNTWAFGLPPGQVATYDSAFSPWPIWTGTAAMRDVSAFNYYHATCVAGSAGDSVSALYSSAQVAGNAPFAWGTGDFLTLNIDYRAT